MTNTTQQVFTNTCGKIFRNQLILATSKRDSSLSYDEIKSISYEKKRNKSDLLIAILPAMLIAISFFLKEHESFLKILFITLGILGMAAVFFKGQTRYVVIVRKTDGKSITVRAAGKREAEKFAGHANSVLQKHKSNNTPGSGGVSANNIMPFASFE
ncbi:hypothetical protein [Flavobacterium psychrotrophum]|uniref:hypothetical protein n=1 Tax=Flavobacterium psychrotrophum TaxID=2294119 RepID=UPI000E31BCFD|nr:hypothetical protein [Flavobacterium psychrotrophum]